VPLPTTTSNVAGVSTLVKPQSMPGTIKPTVVDVLRGSSIAREAALVAERKQKAEQQAAEAIPRRYTGLTERLSGNQVRRRPMVAPLKL
jgi:hypothetical protein